MKLAPWEPDLRTIVDRIDSNDIDLQPDFQRQEVWPLLKKKRLIDTILRGWSIPPIHLVVKSDNRMDVLDGQQRLATIRDFLHSDFSIDGTITPPDNRIKSLDGAFYKSLTSSLKREIDQYSLRCFRITDYLPDEPSELFYRLNQPTMLTAGEQRNALYGPAREQLKRLVQEFETLGNDKKTIGFSNARLAYDDVIARVLYFLESKNFGIKGTEALISDRFRNRNEFDSNVMARARRGIALFSTSRGTLTASRFNKASVLSWLLFFSRFTQSLPDETFMASFLGHTLVPLGKNFVSDAAVVFHDRASLRVTDVSSVVYRDFALWYSYYFLVSKQLPSPIDPIPITGVFELLRQRDDCGFEQALSNILNIELWSSSL